jgi:hypothetical protein
MESHFKLAITTKPELTIFKTYVLTRSARLKMTACVQY